MLSFTVYFYLALCCLCDCTVCLWLSLSLSLSLSLCLYVFMSVFLILHSISVPTLIFFFPSVLSGFLMLCWEVRWLEINRGSAHTYTQTCTNTLNCWAGEFHSSIFSIRRQHHPDYWLPRRWIDCSKEVIVRDICVCVNIFVPVLLCSVYVSAFTVYVYPFVWSLFSNLYIDLVLLMFESLEITREWNKREGERRGRGGKHEGIK